MIDVSKSIKQLVQESGLSQKEMCERTGISASTMSRLINSTKSPSVLMYAAIFNETEKEIRKNGKKTKGNKNGAGKGKA